MLECVQHLQIKQGCLPSSVCMVCHPEMENVKSFTRTNINKPDFTPRKARKLRHFWHFKPTKQNLCGFLWWINVDKLSIYGSLSIDLNFFAHIFPKNGLFLLIILASQTFYPNWPIFLHGYIRHIRDIFQLWIYGSWIRTPAVCLQLNTTPCWNSAMWLTNVL